METAMRTTVSSKIKRPKIETVIMVVTFVIFVLYAISLILPFVWAFLSSLKTDDEYFEKVFAWPRDWLFSNYITAFSEFKVGGTSFIEMFANSVWLTLGGTFFNIFVSAMTAYVMAKYNFKGRDLIYKIIIFKMVIPIVGNLPAKFNLIVNLGINNPHRHHADVYGRIRL